jgi:spore maturation protein CgeB
MAGVNLALINSTIKARYQIADNAFSFTPKDDWKDRIQTIIGDDKQPDTFYPQAKIMRWDNECNLSISFCDRQRKNLV